MQAVIEPPSVDALMADGLSDWLKSQRAVRLAAAEKSKKINYISFAAAAVVAVVVLLTPLPTMFMFVAAGGCIAVGQMLAYNVRAPVIRALKEQMNARIAAAMGCTFNHDATPGPEFQLAKNFDMVPSYDREAFSDHWQGHVGDSSFNLYEAHLQEWQGTGKNRRLETVFRGVVMTVGFTRNFHGVTLVERKGNRLTFFGLRDSITVEGVKLETVNMVDPRLADAFAIWSTDQVEARYLVHPEYVQRLIEIERNFDGHDIRALFHGGNLVILLEGDDQFESGSLDADADRSRMAKTIQQFAALANLGKMLNERPRG